MAVFRVHKNGNYTVMSNNHLKDKGLTLKAKGIMSLMLSLPDDWDYSVQGLVSLGKDGKASVTSALSELENSGYVRRTLAFNKNGQFNGYNYDIYEKPFAEKPFTENPSTGNPSTGNPSTGKPSTGNPPQLNTNIPNTKKESTKEQNTDREKRKRFVPPTVDEVKEYCFERLNGIDAQAFVDYYTARGWMIGKNKMKDWKAAVRTWENRDKANKKDKPSSGRLDWIDSI